MSSNMSINGSNSNGFNSISKAQPVEPIKPIEDVSNVPVNLSATIQTIKELKQAELQGENITLSDEKIIKAIELANKKMLGANTSFQFSIHEQTKQIMVKVMDKDTGEIIREIPPEKTLDMVAKMWELAGIIVDERR